jgi:transposase
VRSKLENFKTFQEIAKEFRLSASYVAKLDSTITEREDELRGETRDLYLPSHLGIHNSRIARTDCALLTHPTEGRVLEVTMSREPHEITARIERWFDRSQFQNVGVVSMPMKRRYRQLVKSLFPKASIMVPKEYLTSLANEVMNAVMIKADQYIARNKEGRDATLQILCKNPGKLSQPQKDHLNKLLLSSALLRSAYEQKQLFQGIFKYGTPERGMEAYARWSESVPAALRLDFTPLLDEPRQWMEEIFAGFPLTFKYYLADLDKMVDKLNKAGRNYSLATIRGRLLYTHKFQDIAPITPHTEDTGRTTYDMALARTGPPPKSYPELGSSVEKILKFLSELP